jgi:hypothetical protein
VDGNVAIPVGGMATILKVATNIWFTK